jgi:tetratricopeptide (TPR) repeat protein
MVAARRDSEARELLARAEALLPQHPLVLHEKARRHLVAGQPALAAPLLERATASAPKHLPFWLTLATAYRLQRRFSDELAALEQVLALDPLHVGALLLKGVVLDQLGMPRTAARFYTNALQARRPETRLPASLQPLLQQAERRVAQSNEEMARHFERQLSAIREGHTLGEMRRFERALDLMLGRRQIHHPAPTLMLFPWLRSYEFFDRDRFPWLDTLEAATEDIQREFLAVLGDESEMVPYINYTQDQPVAQWAELNHSRRWKAYFFWQTGEFYPEHAARCPRTIEALKGCPQVDIPNFGPTAFYSILDAHTQIPPHTGAANTRLTVHLPLVVPPGCEFRVGGDTREWKVGEAWVFDDTIEHEAWNRSDVPRAILLFDVWNPELTELERDLVRSTKAMLLDYYREEEFSVSL